MLYSHLLIGSASFWHRAYVFMSLYAMRTKVILLLWNWKGKYSSSVKDIVIEGGIGALC